MTQEEYTRKLEEAMQEFVDRSDKGEVRNRYTYAKFKDLLPKREKPKSRYETAARLGSVYTQLNVTIFRDNAPYCICEHMNAERIIEALEHLDVAEA